MSKTREITNKLAKIDYIDELTDFFSGVVALNKLKVENEFIIVLKDTNKYPTPNSTIVVGSNDRIFNTLENKSLDRYYTGGRLDEIDGTNDVRYLLTVDSNDGNKVIVFDDNGEFHEFNDDLMVVEPYIYPASSLKSTFRTGFDYDDNILAIKLSDILGETEIYDLINKNDTPLYERSCLNMTHALRRIIDNIYIERGIKENRKKVIRVRINNTIIDGVDFLKDPIIPYSIECIEILFNNGYHIDLVTDAPLFDKDYKNLVKYIDNIDIKYNSINSYLVYDYIVDTRCAMSYSKIDWCSVLKTITNNNYSDYVEIDLVDYSELLNITKDRYDALIDENLLYSLFPDCPEWFLIEQLQVEHENVMYYRELTEEHRLLVDKFNLKEFF